MTRLLAVAVVLLSAATASADRLDEDCELCGLLAWRMQKVVAEKQETLLELKAAKEKRAKKATKPHSRRWIKQEYAVELASAIEASMDSLPKDHHVAGAVCNRGFREGIAGSALQQKFSMQYGRDCSLKIEKRALALLEEFEETLTETIIAGHGAGTTCSGALDKCSANRARLLLGPSYKEDGMPPQALDMLQAGYADAWEIHTDVDGSKYWFNKAQMKSVREAPPGWAQGADGEWAYQKPSGGDDGGRGGGGDAPSTKDEV